MTLPVEFNASSRALHFLNDTGMLSHEELRGTRKVLKSSSVDLCGKCGSSHFTIAASGDLFGGNRRDD